MALDAFTGVLTAQQLVAAARLRAGSPDLHLTPAGVEDLTAPAYVELQMLLDHLGLAWDWPFARIALSLSITARETVLPHQFWRVSFNDPLWIVDCNGNRTRCPLADEGEFFDRITTPAETTGRPEKFWISKATQTLFVDPKPDQQYLGEFHFQPWQPPLNDITSRPWFPWSEYLVSALAVKLCLNQDDSRADKEAILSTKLMKDIRGSLSEQGERTAQIQLNKLVYRTPLQL